MLASAINCNARGGIVCQAYDGNRLFTTDLIAVDLEAKVARLASSTDQLRTGRVIRRGAAYEIAFPALPGALRLQFRIDPTTGRGERELGGDPALYDPGEPIAVMRHSLICTGDLTALSQAAVE